MGTAASRRSRVSDEPLQEPRCKSLKKITCRIEVSAARDVPARDRPLLSRSQRQRRKSPRLAGCCRAGFSRTTNLPWCRPDDPWSATQPASAFEILLSSRAHQILHEGPLVCRKALTTAEEIEEGVAVFQKDGCESFGCRGNLESGTMRGIGAAGTVSEQDGRRGAEPAGFQR